MPGGAQDQPVANAGALLVRAGDHIERERKIGSASGHRADDRKIAFARQGRDPRRRLSATGNKTQCRLVSVDAAIMRRCAQRTTQVRAKRQRPEAAGKRRRRAARGPSGRAAEIPGIISCPVDVVVALPVAQHQRHIGLAEDDGARVLHAGDDQRVFFRHEALELRDTPGRRQSGDIEGFLHRHRDAEQSHAFRRAIGRYRLPWPRCARARSRGRRPH